MSRLAVTALFVGAGVVTAVAAYDHLVRAVTDSSARTWALAGYWILRAAVVAAFSFFVAVRADPRRHARSPIAFISTGAALGAMILLRQPAPDTDTGLVLLGDTVALASYLCAGSSRAAPIDSFDIRSIWGNSELWSAS